jgi:hypothetical protein
MSVPAEALRRTARATRPSVPFALALALAAPALPAQAVPEGAQFQVNTHAPGYQFWPDVGFDADGDFVVVWESDSSTGGDPDRSIQARRYAADGTPLGPQFQVNTYTGSRQEGARVGVAPGGEFVVVWWSYLGWDGGDDDGASVQARRFDADGAPLGPEFQVNTYTTDDQYRPNVAAGADGGFVVAWVSTGSPGPDQSLTSIQGQRFDALGAPAGSQFQVNTYSLFNQLFTPGLAVAPNGDFVVAWTSDGSFGTDSEYWSIQGQRYDGDGGPLGGEFQVNSYTLYNQSFPDVAFGPGGEFVVVWSSYGSFEDGFSAPQGQRYDAAGAPAGGQFQVNDTTIGPHIYPRVATAPNGDFVVVFTANTTQGGDDSEFSVHGKRYRADGTEAGAQFLANSFTTGRQFLPVVASDPEGDFLVAWQSNGSAGGDNSQTSIQAQRFQNLFADGFETGDTSRWSAAFP